MTTGVEPGQPDWGPFGRPIFDGPEADALRRVGVVDIGSNSVRLVVFDGAARSPAYFYNEKIMCALGAGLSETGRLNPSGRARAVAALIRFNTIADGMGISPLTCVATAAVREAEDGPDFREEVRKATGLEIYVVDGDEEARLSAQGVLLGWPGAYGMVCDIGGSSMELANIRAGQVGRRLTSPLGPLKLRGIGGGKKGVKSHIKGIVADLHERMAFETGMRLFLVGGSWRAIARIDMDRRGYPLTVLHEYRMTPKAVTKTRQMIEEADLEELRARLGISAERMSLVPLAVQVLSRVVRTFRPKDIAVSSYGIREGMLYEEMPQIMRERDPLIEACRFIEAKDARMPGFGRKLYGFVSPLFNISDIQQQRLIRAACLLHDVSWRAHPDYRHDVAFDNVTRANLGGLKHSERVFLGLALLHRYTNKREGSRYEEMFALVDEAGIRRAEVLGKAMRLGAMLWVGADEVPARLSFKPRKKVLTIELDESARALFGEVADSRFKALASALQAEPVVVMPPERSPA